MSPSKKVFVSIWLAAVFAPRNGRRKSRDGRFCEPFEHAQPFCGVGPLVGACVPESGRDCDYDKGE